MMKSRVSEAKRRHNEGYNCCQAVVCSYSDLLNMDEETAFRTSEGFGAGISGRGETCGAVCAMVMLAGLKNSGGTSKRTKASTMGLGKAMSKKFEEWNTTCNCWELKGVKGNGGMIRSCNGCVADCARIVEDTLFEGEFEPYEERKTEEE